MKFIPEDLFDDFYEICQSLYGDDSAYIDKKKDCIYVGPEGYLIAVIELKDGVLDISYRACLTPEAVGILTKSVILVFGVENVSINGVFEQQDNGTYLFGNDAIIFVADNVYELWYGTKDKKQAHKIAKELAERENGVNVELYDSIDTGDFEQFDKKEVKKTDLH